MNRAWKYKFFGELKILNFVAGHPELEISYVVCIILLVENRTEKKKMQTRCSSFFGLLFHTTISAIVSSSCVSQRMDTIRMTLGSRDQFRIIAVVSGPETFEESVVWREWEEVSPSKALEIGREIASGLTAKSAASNTVLDKDSHKILL